MMQTVQIQGRNCHIYGAAGAQFLLVQLVDDHDMQGMEAELAALSAACRSPFLLAAVPVEVWNDALSPWPAPPVWGRQGFGGGSAGTLDFLLRQLLPALKQQFALPADVHIILGGYSLAGLFALWAATQSSAFCGIAAASPSVWFPGWNGYEAAHPVQTSCVYLSLGDREEHTKNAAMAPVGANIRALYQRLQTRGTRCTLEWNAGGHFKEPNLRTAKAFAWTMENCQ